MSLIINALRHPILISHLSGANNYSNIHFRNGEKLMVSKSLSFLGKKLPQFVRIHKTILLNPDCVEEFSYPSHSRTSGSVILEGGDVLPVSRRQWLALIRRITNETAPSVQPERSVAIITGDTTKSLLLRQLFADQWPQTLLQVVDNGAILPTQLLTVTEADRPSLILLDLRQTSPGRLALVRRLKEDPQLRRLPIVLLLAPNTMNSTLGPSYALQANSAVLISDDNSQFMRTMESVCGYWLTMAALPSA